MVVGTPDWLSALDCGMILDEAVCSDEAVQLVWTTRWTLESGDSGVWTLSSLESACVSRTETALQLPHSDDDQHTSQFVWCTPDCIPI
jgi:hypothetical protein